ncbi:MAG: hypothetical protein QF385_14655, partial [SAR324 cluster bacterium]|nr:hypothetical protein [SAR324 cluster bacterium]
LFIINGHEIQAVDLPTTKTASPETVFGGVGRLYEDWHAGYDFMIMSTPHTSAHRSLGITNRALWLEWWTSDQFGVKGFYSTQHFQSFGNDEFDIASRHVGGLFKGRFPINPEWQVTAGIGMAQSVTQFPEKSKSSNMLVSEFRIGVMVYEHWTTEFGLMTLDGASGDGPEDSRLGSTNYLIGIGYGF